MKTGTTCTDPFTGNGGAFPCGKCLPCRIGKRREWTHRIMLEAALCADNAFLTLTYEKLEQETLNPDDLKNFLKRLRKNLAPMKVRFYAVGEYGEKHGRPHFHVALFGYPSCRSTKRKFNCHCKSCSVIRDTWGHGFIMNDKLEAGSARYIARYVIKKMTRHDDPRLQPNQHPEFARMSLRPGVGNGVVEAVATVLLRYKLLTAEGDVPVTLAHGGIEWPLGRYLRRKIREALGLDPRSPNVLSAEAAYKNFQENDALQAMWLASKSNPADPSPKKHLLQAAQGRIDQIIARHNIFSKKGDL